ncbi:MAG: MBL fold metallo-hydrolase [Clostridia bacterium]|nr:MBL fold metallo-hydrolase [Clostridia bacterium]
MKTNILNLGNRLVNCWAYPIENGYVIIDTGYKSNYRNFIRQLKKNHIALADIKYCFLTHSHDDHTGFLARLMSLNSDMRVIAHPQALDVLRKGHNPYGGCTNKSVFAYYKTLTLFGGGKHIFPPITPDLEKRIIIVDESNINELEHILGGKIIETTGHTRDSICLLLDNGYMFCGDIAMNGFPSRHNVSVWAEEEQQYCASWQKVIALKPTKLFPGHGKPFDYKRLEQNFDFAKKIKIYSLNN